MSSVSTGVTMNTIRNVSVGLIALCAAAAWAQEGIKPADPAVRQQQKKAEFAEQEKTLQTQSRSSASGSARVDKSIQAADPVPKATTKQEKKQRFADQEQVLQGQSRSSASGSPRVDKSAAAASPVSKAASKSERKAQFSTQEQQLQRESKP
jgi:methionyl-tRNA formyltransferase